VAILSVLVFLWGLRKSRICLNGISAPKFPIDGLHNLVQTHATGGCRSPRSRPPSLVLNWIVGHGHGHPDRRVIAGSSWVSASEDVADYGETLKLVRFSLLTIAAMLALGFTTKGQVWIDAGLAFAHAGWLYPFFRRDAGWLGVALTGSDTSSNVLFGGCRRSPPSSSGFSPVLMAAANSSGGVMGKMIDAQSIVVASTRRNGTATKARSCATCSSTASRSLR
jgi:lactate permease